MCVCVCVLACACLCVRACVCVCVCRYFYDVETANYTVARYLADVDTRYGGIDSMLMWPTYVNSFSNATVNTISKGVGTES